MMFLTAFVFLVALTQYVCGKEYIICDERNSSNGNFHLLEDVSTLVNEDELSLSLCQAKFTLKTELLLQNRKNISLIGMGGMKVLIECGENTLAGIRFDNVTNLKLENLWLKGCGIAQNNQKNSSSLLISNSLNVSLNNVYISHSSVIGAFLFNTVGKVVINGSVFESNQVPKENVSCDDAGGLYIKIDQNKEGCSSYEINACTFKNNHASSFPPCSKNEAKRLCGRGGGIGLNISERANNNTIMITNNTIESNTALWGGGLYVMFYGSAESNQLVISNSTFRNNSSPTKGGGGIAVIFLSTGDLKAKHNSVRVNNCTFTSNKAKFGGGVTIYSTPDRDFLKSNNSVDFNDSVWTYNTALIGAAVDLSSHVWSKVKGGLPDIRFVNCSFQCNSIFNEWEEHGYVSHAKGKGVFYAVGYSVEFSKQTLFSKNNGSALYLISSVANFLSKSKAIFSENRGFSGGAITLVGFSAIRVNKNSTFRFVNNIAMDRGGAIAEVTINKKDFIDTKACFIQILEKANTEFVFENNSAGSSGREVEVEGHYGHSIFVSTLEPCSHLCNLTDEETDNKTNECAANFIFKNRIKYDVTTSGARIQLAENTSLPLKAIPGKLTFLPINMTDEFSHEVSALYHVEVSNINNSQVTIGHSDSYISEKEIRFYGSPGDTAKVTFETINVREVGLSLLVQMEDCPPGYILRSKKVAKREVKTCICSAATSDKRYPGISRCNATEFVAFLSKGYWIAYDQTGEYGNEENLLTGYCPRGYCSTNNDKHSEEEYKLPKNTSIEALNELICGKNRKGILCGKCIENYTSFYHSRRYACKEARLCNLGWLFYILSEIVPITLVFIVIILFNINLTTGAFNAFLFFAQVSDTMLITANGFIHFPPKTYYFLHIIKSIYGMFNLSFFTIERLSFCLWKSAQTLDLLMFKYVAIVYALVLVFVIIAFMNSCNCSANNKVLSKLRRKKINAYSTIIHGLTGFFVMCYSECTRISLLLLTPVLLQSSSQTGNSYVREVVFFNGDLNFFKGTHLLYAIPALIFIVVLGIIPPLLLIAYPLCYKVFAFLKISESKFVKVLCRCIPLESLRPLFDSFQSSFRDNCRFFSGLYFLYRLVILCSFAFLHNLNEFYLMAQVQLLLILTVHLVVQPYKKRWHNMIDGLIFMILATINAMTMFNYKHATELLDYSQVIHVVSKFQTTLLYAPLIYIVLYCTKAMHHKMNVKGFLRKIRSRAKTKTSSNSKTRHKKSSMIIGMEETCDELLESNYHRRKLFSNSDNF